MENACLVHLRPAYAPSMRRAQFERTLWEFLEEERLTTLYSETLSSRETLMKMNLMSS